METAFAGQNAEESFNTVDLFFKKRVHPLQLPYMNFFVFSQGRGDQAKIGELLSKYLALIAPSEE